MTEDYRIESKALAVEDGGGFLAWAPDLPGCMSDGDSPETAEANCREAIREWLDQAREDGLERPGRSPHYAIA